MSIEAAVTTPGPLSCCIPCPGGSSTQGWRTGTRQHPSPHIVLCPWTGCHHVLLHAVRSPGVTLQFWSPCCHPTAPAPLVPPCSLQCQVPYFSYLPCRYNLAQHCWGLPRCPIAQSGVIGRVGLWRTLQVVWRMNGNPLWGTVWKTLVEWVRESGVPSSKESTGESQLVWGEHRDTPK